MSYWQDINFHNSFSQLPENFYTKIKPTPLPNPFLVSVNSSAASLIDLNADELNSADFAAYMSGNKAWANSDSLAMVYSGHQFGVYVPRLGDGRAHLLGEIKNNHGQTWGIQLKGSGITPYSREGDGRAVLRSSFTSLSTNDK